MPKAYVVGLGRSGIAAARLLKQKGWEVILSDRSTSEALQNIEKILKKEDINVKLSHNLVLDPANLPYLIVVSPGVPWDIPVLGEARSLGIDTIGEIELAWRYLNSSPWVGITGTNGKTTTTALIAAIFQASGINAPACGNIGYAACELALQGNREQEAAPFAQLGETPRPQWLGNREDKGKFTDPLPITHYQNQFDWIIAEISSYQIESSCELAPKIGIWTTFTPDHLNRHKTLENYYEIKASLLRRCSYQIFNGDDPYLYQIGLNHWQDAYWTSLQGKSKLLCESARGVYIEDNWVVAFGELILPINLFKMVGLHNQQNLLMAVAAARLAGIPKNAIAQAIATFPGVPHRLEYICTIAGIDFINDSKATNYDAAEVGLASVAGPVILIAGGEAKEGDDRGWIEMIQAKAAIVLLIGEAAFQFAQRFRKAGYETYEIVETMENAVKRGVELAQQQQAKVVLLSPACASFDQYQSFEHRGEHFRELCLQS